MFLPAREAGLYGAVRVADLIRASTLLEIPVPRNLLVCGLRVSTALPLVFGVRDGGAVCSCLEVAFRQRIHHENDNFRYLSIAISL